MHKRYTTEEERMNFFVPLSDLLLGVLFLFIVMVVALSLRMSQESRRHEQATELLVGASIKIPDEIANRSVLRQMAEDTRETMLRAKGVRLHVDEKGGVLRAAVQKPQQPVPSDNTNTETRE